MVGLGEFHASIHLDSSGTIHIVDSQITLGAAYYALAVVEAECTALQRCHSAIAKGERHILVHIHSRWPYQTVAGSAHNVGSEIHARKIDSIYPHIEQCAATKFRTKHPLLVVDFIA